MRKIKRIEIVKKIGTQETINSDRETNGGGAKPEILGGIGEGSEGAREAERE